MAVFENLFGFLLNSERLNSLDDHDMRKCCTTFSKTFTHDGSSDVVLNDLISELQVLQVTLSGGFASFS